MEKSNPFAVEAEACRYNTYRPRYHSIVFEHYQRVLGRDFSRSLDVCCGTGHSTVALSKISDNTVGCDLSEAMLGKARENSGIRFVQCDAVKLPFDDNSFDFLNVSMGFHWLQQARFLKEAQRVLCEGGHLSVDNYGFLGTVSEDSGKQKAHHELVESHLPTPRRGEIFPALDLLQDNGFRAKEEFQFEHRISMTCDEFVNFVKTWSNFQVLDDDKQNHVAKLMEATYPDIFEGQSLSLKFGGRARLYLLAAQSANS